MVKKIKDGKAHIVYPYTKLELLEIYKSINAAPVKVASDRFNPAKKAEYFSKAVESQSKK